jgi:hypothetical protein
VEQHANCRHSGLAKRLDLRARTGGVARLRSRPAASTLSSSLTRTTWSGTWAVAQRALVADNGELESVTNTSNKHLPRWQTAPNVAPVY